MTLIRVNFIGANIAARCTESLSGQKLELKFCFRYLKVDYAHAFCKQCEETYFLFGCEDKGLVVRTRALWLQDTFFHSKQ